MLSGMHRYNALTSTIFIEATFVNIMFNNYYFKMLSTEGSQLFFDFALHHFASSVLFDVPGMSFCFEEDHRRMQRKFLTTKSGSFSPDQQVHQDLILCIIFCDNLQKYLIKR